MKNFRTAGTNGSAVCPSQFDSISSLKLWRELCPVPGLTRSRVIPGRNGLLIKFGYHLLFLTALQSQCSRPKDLLAETWACHSLFPFVERDFAFEVADDVASIDFSLWHGQVQLGGRNIAMI